MSVDPNRRCLLFALSLLPVMSAWSSSRLVRDVLEGSAFSRSGAVEETLSLLPSLSAARQIGHTYLEMNPAENSREVLLELVAGQSSSHPQGEGCQVISVRHRADLDAGRIVFVEGWPLSITEARLCALSCFL